MRRFRSYAVVFIVVAAVAAVSPWLESRSDRSAAERPPVSFRGNVLPVFVAARCTNCHGERSGLSVETVTDLLEGGDHGPAITPVDTKSSLLVQKISPGPPFGLRMPPHGPYLADSAILVIEEWIAEGAKDN